MATIPTQIRIDAVTKTQASQLFDRLGLDMSGAVNLFLHQCVLRGGIPFSVELPHFNTTTLAAIDEANKIARDPAVPSYNSMKDLKQALLTNDSGKTNH